MDIINNVSIYILPIMIFLIVGYGVLKNDLVYESFIDGAKEGFKNLIGILPAVVGIIVAIGMFRASGALEIMVSLIKPLTNLIGIPSEVVPLALIKPISGSGSLAVFQDALKTYGADSFVGRVASTMMGCTETTFYTIAVYFGSVSIKNSRHTLKSALIADFVGIVATVWVWRLFLSFIS